MNTRVEVLRGRPPIGVAGERVLEVVAESPGELVEFTNLGREQRLEVRNRSAAPVRVRVRGLPGVLELPPRCACELRRFEVEAEPERLLVLRAWPARLGPLVAELPPLAGADSSGAWDFVEADDAAPDPEREARARDELEAMLASIPRSG